MKPTLYLETTIPSYLASQPSRDLIIAGHQQITREWWTRRRSDFEIYVSQLVLEEVKAGDPEAAQQRLGLISGLPVLNIGPEEDILADRILNSGVLPRKAAADALHIAVAASHGMDFLMTWNLAHLANAFIAKAVAKVCSQRGLQCPVICTPEALLGE